MPAWQPIGRHRFYREGPIFWLETYGEVSAADASQLIDELGDADRESPQIGVLVDVRGGFSLPADARRVIATRSREEHRGRPPLPMAVVGAALAVRAVVTLLINAVSLLTRRRNSELAFFTSTAEGLEWLTPLALSRRIPEPAG